MIKSRSFKLVYLSTFILFLSFTSILGRSIFAQSDIGPEVSVVSPEDGFATNQDTISVSVHFKATANPNDKGAVEAEVRNEVRELCGRFPVYAALRY